MIEKQINRLRQITNAGEILCMHGKKVDKEVCPGCTHTLITPGDQNYVNAAKNAFADLYKKARSVADELTEGLFFTAYEESCVGYGPPTYREQLLSAHVPTSMDGMNVANNTLKNAAAKYAFWGIRAITHALSGQEDPETGAKPFSVSDGKGAGGGVGNKCLEDAIDNIHAAYVWNYEPKLHGEMKKIDRVIVIYPTCDGVSSIKDVPEEINGIKVDLWPAPPIHKFKDTFVIWANEPFVFNPGPIALELNDGVLDVVAWPKFSVRRPWAIAKING